MIALIALLTTAFGAPEHGMGKPPLNAMLLADELEIALPDPELPIGWDAMAWIGGDQHRLWLKSEGNLAAVSGAGELENQVLYSRLVAPFWEVQVGARGDLDLDGGPARGFLVLGVEGLAPYWFELAPSLFLSHRGEVSVRLVASHDVFLTQRLILQPSAELNANVQPVPDLGQGAGPTDVSIGARVRYEVRREFAPYVGVQWEQQLLDTARLTNRAGQPTSQLQAVAGLRLWL